MSQQPPEEHSPALDSLYEALTEIQAHLGEHHKERQGLLDQIEQAQRDLQDQRQQAAAAGERDTYNRLSEDLAKLTRAYRVASEDPDADPLDEYQYDDSEPQPQDQPPTPKEDPDDPEHRQDSPLPPDGVGREPDQQAPPGRPEQPDQPDE